MHAVGHAFLALLAGGVAVAVVQAWGMEGGRSSRWGAGGSLSERALLLSAIGLAVAIVKGMAGVYATFVQGQVAGEVGGRLRLDLLDALLAVHRLRSPRHRDHSGDEEISPPTAAVAALTERVQEVEVGLKQGLIGGLRAAVQLAPLAVLLVVLSTRMAAVAALVLGVFGLLLGRVRAGYRKGAARAAREREQLLEAADESVRHAELWVSYGAEAKARARVESLGDALARGAARLEARGAALSAANEVLGALALLAAVAAARAGCLGRAADGATLLAFSIAFFVAYRPIRELADARLAWARGQAAYRELRSALERAAAAAEEAPGVLCARRPGGPDGVPGPEGEQPPSARVPGWGAGVLELRDLRLARGRCGPLSLRVEPGAIVVIAGPTGAGKTTLLRTLLGLEHALGGEVLFDGASLGEAPAGPLARPFAWVPQDAPLLADTLDANVTLGAPGADAVEALARLGASPLAVALRGARLGAGGRAVSGGERQWIALARAIATRQPVLLLDEPTSGLDASAQRRVLEAIERLRGQRTVLLVTHRSEPLALADVIVRLGADSPMGQAA